MSEKIVVVVSKDRNPRPEQEAMHRALCAALEHRPEFDLLVVPHLYDLPPNGSTVERLRSMVGDMIVLAWLYPRSSFWVLDASDVRGRLGRTPSLGEEEALEPKEPQSGRGEIPNRTIWCFDLRSHDEAEAFLREIDEVVLVPSLPFQSVEQHHIGTGIGKAEEFQESTRQRWYPVIDLNRCTNCKECLNFCLFGVYGLDEIGWGFVEQPDACRPGCPACARICPAGAIMFPQHKDPAIAGDPLASLQGLKLDLSQIFAGIDPAAMAARERADALTSADAPSPRDHGPTAPGAGSRKKGLDNLVDEVDKLDF